MAHPNENPLASITFKPDGDPKDNYYQVGHNSKGALFYFADTLLVVDWGAARATHLNDRKDWYVGRLDHGSRQASIRPTIKTRSMLKRREYRELRFKLSELVEVLQQRYPGYALLGFGFPRDFLNTDEATMSMLIEAVRKDLGDNYIDTASLVPPVVESALDESTVSQALKVEKNYPKSLVKRVEKFLDKPVGRNVAGFSPRLTKAVFDFATKRTLDGLLFNQYGGVGAYIDYPINDKDKVLPTLGLGQYRLDPTKAFAVKRPPIGTKVTLSLVASVLEADPDNRDNEIAIGEAISDSYLVMQRVFRERGVWDYLNAKKDDPAIPSKLNTITTNLDDLAGMALDWHNAMKERLKAGVGPEGRTLIPFPDGFKWVALDRGYCKLEGEAAGHCGNVSAKEGDNIYSLRDKDGKVMLTFIVNDGVLGEAKGRGNDKPSVKYHKYIIELLESNYIKTVVGGGYLPKHNFQIADLTDAQQKALLAKKPDIDPMLALRNGSKTMTKVGKYRIETPSWLKKGERVFILDDNVDVSDWVETGGRNSVDGDALKFVMDNGSYENIHDWDFPSDAKDGYDALSAKQQTLVDKMLYARASDEDKALFDEGELDEKDLLKQDDDLGDMLARLYSDAYRQGTENNLVRHYISSVIGDYKKDGTDFVNYPSEDYPVGLHRERFYEGKITAFVKVDDAIKFAGESFEATIDGLEDALGDLDGQKIISVDGERDYNDFDDDYIEDAFEDAMREADSEAYDIAHQVERVGVVESTDMASLAESTVAQVLKNEKKYPKAFKKVVDGETRDLGRDLLSRDVPQRLVTAYLNFLTRWWLDSAVAEITKFGKIQDAERSVTKDVRHLYVELMGTKSLSLVFGANQPLPEPLTPLSLLTFVLDDPNPKHVSATNRNVVVEFLLDRGRYVQNTETRLRDYVLGNKDDATLPSKLNTVTTTKDDLIAWSADWHEALREKATTGIGPEGKTLISFPDGFKWVSLGRGYCKLEGDAAGHCGNVNAKPGDDIYSLRDEAGKVWLTFIVNDGVLGEAKGRNNDKPSDKYHKYILKLLESDYIKAVKGGGYNPKNNFQLADLTKAQRKALVDEKPDIDPFLAVEDGNYEPLKKVLPYAVQTPEWADGEAVIILANLTDLSRWVYESGGRNVSAYDISRVLDGSYRQPLSYPGNKYILTVAEQYEYNSTSPDYWDAHKLLTPENRKRVDALVRKRAETVVRDGDVARFSDDDLLKNDAAVRAVLVKAFLETRRESTEKRKIQGYLSYILGEYKRDKPYFVHYPDPDFAPLGFFRADYWVGKVTVFVRVKDAVRLARDNHTSDLEGIDRAIEDLRYKEVIRVPATDDYDNFDVDPFNRDVKDALRPMERQFDESIEEEVGEIDMASLDESTVAQAMKSFPKLTPLLKDIAGWVNTEVISRNNYRFLNELPERLRSAMKVFLIHAAAAVTPPISILYPKRFVGKPDLNGLKAQLTADSKVGDVYGFQLSLSRQDDTYRYSVTKQSIEDVMGDTQAKAIISAATGEHEVSGRTFGNVTKGVDFPEAKVLDVLLHKDNLDTVSRSTKQYVGEAAREKAALRIFDHSDYLIANKTDNTLVSLFNGLVDNPREVYDELQDRSEKWTEKEEEKAKEGIGAEGRTLISFPDGYKWVSLDRGYCKREGDAAGHCGNVNPNDGDNILSLRDKRDKVHLTFVVNDKELGQSKGNRNEKPDKKYHKYIIELLKSEYVDRNVGGGHADENNFKLDDLDSDDKEELLKLKPALDGNPPKTIGDFRYNEDDLAYEMSNMEDGILGMEDWSDVPVYRILSVEDGNEEDGLQALADILTVSGTGGMLFPPTARDIADMLYYDQSSTKLKTRSDPERLVWDSFDSRDRDKVGHMAYWRASPATQAASTSGSLSDYDLFRSDKKMVAALVELLTESAEGFAERLRAFMFGKGGRRGNTETHGDYMVHQSDSGDIFVAVSVDTLADKLGTPSMTLDKFAEAINQKGYTGGDTIDVDLEELGWDSTQDTEAFRKRAMDALLLLDRKNYAKAFK